MLFHKKIKSISLKTGNVKLASAQNQLASKVELLTRAMALGQVAKVDLR